QPFRAAVVVFYFQLPGRYETRLARDAVHTEFAVTLRRVVGLNFGNDLPDSVHDGLERASHWHRFQAITVGMAQGICRPGAADQGLGWHAAGVEAVTAHPVFLDQGDPGLDGGGDVSRDQTG